ncbi:MAG: NTP transferase domain-containing protein [Lachnospiraceae bacterium]|jgi:CTP:phosphocholine cytidylyltransferase-like protein/thiamine kinase-like enzyme|nr:NTP transferase domain-containing protein [Lachnospiraceae bacterium]
MNIRECDILCKLWETPYVNQRTLAEACGVSLGMANRCLKNLKEYGYLDGNFRLTEQAHREISEKKPKNAVILAAGFGMRMVPINMEIPKAFLEVKGELLIERIIRQLHEAGVREIYVVVGYMKERFDYLIDRFGVRLVVNPDYGAKNNLHSLKRAEKYLADSYLIPCDVWCEENPFRKCELYSWYMVSDRKENGSMVRVNRNMELVAVREDVDGNAMVGISYLLKEDAERLKKQMEILCGTRHGDRLFWEAALYDGGKMAVRARMVRKEQVAEINTYEQLRELDDCSGQLQSDKLQAIADVLDVSMSEITDLSALKKGMTNRSFLFSCRGSGYIMRIPGEGTERLINRSEEAAVYRELQGRNICEDVILINPDNGYKITRFIDGARTCDPANPEETAACMKKLRRFHELALKVGHEFDLFGHIDFYEALWGGCPSAYEDYPQTKENVLRLRPFIGQWAKEKVLTHIDAVPDNFLLFKNEEGEEEIRLIDWEYAAMQDPHVDIAMFCIYSMYDREQIDGLMGQYFTEGCPDGIRIKIYCYIAVCGLLWSNWCEYKRNLGVEFGEYSLRQYRYAKDYYGIAAGALGWEAEEK